MTKIHYIILTVLVAALFSSCQKAGSDIVPDRKHIIAFSNYIEAEGDASSRNTRAGAVTKPLYEFVPDFVVYGVNGNLSDDGATFTKKDLVYDNYVVWHQSGSAATTETNTNDWEYVGSYTTGGGKTTTTQRIKYWDYSQNCHYFWALSDADKGAFTSSNISADGRVANYVLDISDENLSTTMALYYSEIKRVDIFDYGQVVRLQFIPYLTKVRIAFYETIPGAVVNNLRVGSSSDISISSQFVNSGRCHLTYSYPSEQVTTWIEPTTSDATMNFGPVQYRTLTPRAEGEEDYLPSSFLTGTYLARSSDTPSYALGGGAEQDYYMYVLPYEQRDVPITLTCGYDLINPTTGEVTPMENILATVPVEYTRWKPNYCYTYVFKIIGEQKMDLDDVIIDPWRFGASQNEEWRNW